MRLIPRSYQIEAVNSIYSHFSKSADNPILALPTGTGKSVIIAMFLESIYRHYPNQRVMVLTHVRELIDQNHKKLMDIWPQAPAGIYSAGLNKRQANHPVTFAGIGSVVKRAALFRHIDLIIVDECHMVSPKGATMYQRFIKDLKQINPALKVIGFTATPWRLGHGRLTDEGGLFQATCFDITDMKSFNRLIDEGFLSTVVPKSTRQIIDVDGVRMRGGEYVQSELQVAVDRDEITDGAISEIIEQGSDRSHWLIFASGIEHAENIGQMLEYRGVPNVVIHSKLGAKERDSKLEDFKAGRVRAAVNNNVLTTGFDFPGIDLIAVLRPTMSTPLWLQMIGRGTRPVYAEGFDLNTIEGRLAAIAAGPKQNCLVLDFAGNTKRLGPINDPVVPRRKGQKAGTAPVRTCELCSTYNHASARHCVCCGAEFTFQVKIKETAGTGDLIKIDEPVVETIAVDRVTYAPHEKPGMPTSVVVTYYCGLNRYREFVCPEHTGWAGRKAKSWWEGRHSGPAPATTRRFIEQSDQLAIPTKVRVWLNKKYPEVLGVAFD